MTSRPAGGLPSDELRPLLRTARRALRFKGLGFLTLVGVFGVALAVGWLWPRKYRSEAVVYYREGLQWNQSESASPRRVGQRLKELLLSRSQLTAIVSELKIYPDLVAAGRIGEAVEEVRNATTFRFDQGDVFVLSFTGSSPEEAQRVTARLTDVLIEVNARLRTQQAEVAKEFLDSEKKRKEVELSDRQAELLRFLAKHPEFAQEQKPSVGVTIRTRAKAPPPPDVRDSSALGALRREEARLRRQLASPGEIPLAPPDATLLAARNEAAARLKDAQRDLASRRERFTEQHPDVRAAAAAVVTAEAALRRVSDALAASQAPIPTATLKERLARIEQEIASYRRESQQVNEPPQVESSDAAKRIVAVETEWARLNREVDEARERLQQLDSQQFVATMTATLLTSGQATQITVVDPAFRPAQPLGMRRSKVILLCAGVALLAAFLAVAIAALRDDLVEDADDVDPRDVAPVLAVVPRGPVERSAAARLPPRGAGARAPAALAADRAAPLASAAGAAPAPARDLLAPTSAAALGPACLARVRVDRVPVADSARGGIALLAAPDGPTAASYRLLRHRVCARGASVLLLTSPRAGDGKTAAATNLALALAESGRERVLLLDASFRRPAIAPLLGFDPPACLREQIELHRSQPLAPWIVVETGAPGLHVAAARPGGDPSPFVDGRGLALAIGELRQAGYDRVVVDGPPVLEGADVNVIEECVDGILLVARARRSHAADLRDAAEQIGRAKLVGVVLLGA